MRPAILFWVVVVGVCLGWATSGLGAPESTSFPTGSLEIAVTDAATGEPIPYANLVRSDLPGGWLTGDDGVCRVASLPAGLVSVRAVHISYRSSHEVVLVVKGGEATRVEIQLAREAHTMAPVRVSADQVRDLREENDGRQTVHAQQASSLPNPTDDAFQALRVLPGITAGDVGGEFRVRGGGIEETLVLLDGLPLRTLFHGREFGGITGVVPFRIVDRIDVYAGAFPAEYGGRLSGVVDLSLRSKGEPGFHGSAAVDVTSARFLSETHGRYGSLFVSAREGYLDRVLRQVQEEASIEPAYRDFFVGNVWRVGARGTWSVYGMRSEDRARYEDGIDDHFVDANSEDSYGWSTLRLVLGSRAMLRFTGWYAEADSDRDLGGGRADLVTGLRAGASSSLGLELGSHYFSVGGGWERESRDARFVAREIVEIRADGTLVDHFGPEFDDRRDRAQTYAFLQDEWHLGPVALNGGARYSHDDEVDEDFVDWRLSAAFSLSSSTVLRTAWGQFSQSPELELAAPNELQVISRRVQEATHQLVGIEQRLGAVQLGLEVFRKDFPVLDGVVSRTIQGETELRAVTDGETRGLELWLHGAGGPSSWWVSYAIGESEWSDGEGVYRRDFDQMHTVSFANTWQLGRGWDLGLNYRFHTGTPYTSERWEQGEDSQWILTEGRPNAQRLPDYHRADVRLRRWFRFEGWDLSVYADALNLTNHDNVLWYAWQFRDADGVRRNNPQRVTRTGMPGIPSLGVEVRW